MAQKYYNTQETADKLGITPDNVKELLDRRELHGYRDGADWKFKVEDIDRLVKDRAADKSASPDEEGAGDVLLSEIVLGQAEAGASGTVIGMDLSSQSSADADIQLVGSDILGIEKPKAKPVKVNDDLDSVDSNVSQFEELDLTLEEDLTLDDSSVKLSSKQAAGGSDAKPGSDIDLSGRQDDDDDLVLSGSGAGSNVTIGGDSGISLVDPSDSGLSLEQPLNIGTPGDESLELGEDDLLVSSEQGGSPPRVKTDSDFLLTPMDDSADVDDSASGSQVIALDAEGDESATMIGAGSGAMTNMLDAAHPALDVGLGSPSLSGVPLLTPTPGVGISEGAPVVQAGGVFYESPYTSWQVAGLVGCSVLLMFCGMMMYDLMRNMWSWEGAFNVNSALMDAVLSLF